MQEFLRRDSCWNLQMQLSNCLLFAIFTYLFQGFFPNLEQTNGIYAAVVLSVLIL